MKFGFHGENFIDEADAAASIAATRGVKVGGALGNVYAVCIAGDGGFTIAKDKKVTLTATESDTLDGEYATNGITSVRTFAEAKTFAEGETIAELPFATYAKMFAKVAFACDDTGADGKIKVIAMARG